MEKDARVAVLPLLKMHEGFRSKPYQDTVGKLTIGYGRNLEDVGIEMAEAEVLLKNDVDRALKVIHKCITKKTYSNLDLVRQTVLLNMAFNLGYKLRGFKKMIAALKEGDYNTASVEMLDSKWAGQVKMRAKTLAKMMKTGKMPKV